MPENDQPLGSRIARGHGRDGGGCLPPWRRSLADVPTWVVLTALAVGLAVLLGFLLR